MRSARLAAVLAASSLVGCPADDLCVPAADSERVVHVQPRTRPGPDNRTVVDTFHSIQSALDAVGGDRGRATVCVADGTYFEQLTVPADTHLVAAGAVRVRPPQTRDDALPTTVDRVLMTLKTGPEGSIVVDGFDLRRGGLCLDAEGDGEALLRDMAVIDCAVGLRSRGASLTLHDVMLENHAIRGVDLVTSTLHTESGTTLLRNGRPELGRGLTAITELAPDLGWTEGLASGRGALIAVDSDVTLTDTVIDENEYLGGVLDVAGGSLTLRDVRIRAQRAASNPEGFTAGAAGGDGPLVAANGALVSVTGLIARSERQGLFALTGSSTLLAKNVDWSGRAQNTTPEGAPGPAVQVSGGGSVVLWHASLLSPEDAAGIEVSGADLVSVEVANSILWGHGTAGILVDGADPALTVRYSLFEDPSVTGNQLVTAADPGWAQDADGVLVIGADSPARCAGAGDLDVTTDLLGNLRPFEDGKAPDLGAIELQQACP